MVSIKQLHQQLRDRKVKAVDLTEKCFDSLESKQEVNAFTSTCKDLALEQAQAVDVLFDQGHELSMLAGIPFSAKDALSITGIPTQSASHILSGYTSPYTATSIDRLLAQKAIFVGKNNQDSFGFGSSSENSDFGVTRNPWDLTRVAGGSSGGSAASVAAAMSVFSIGEDTGGSIRLPANFCGVTGLKVTYGRVSRYGAIAFASSLDTIGPIGRSVEDLAVVLETIAGHDERDATTLSEKVPKYSQLLNQQDTLKGKTIGISEDLMGNGVDREIVESLERTKETFQSLGATIKSISLPFARYGVGAYYIIAPSEASSNLSRFDGIRFGLSKREHDSLEAIYVDTKTEGFNEEVKRRVMLGTYALSSGYYDAYFDKAQRIRTLMKQDFEKTFAEVDFLLAPVAPVLPFKVGEHAGDPLSVWLMDVFTIPINIAGIPSLAFPTGISNHQLPIGLQLIGPQLSEVELLQAGHLFQKETDWHTRILEQNS